jgi:hypothetical protein
MGARASAKGMNFRFTVVETSLNRAEFRWKWLQFVLRTAILGIVLSLLALAFGGAILAGWITRKDFAMACAILMGVVGLVAWAVISISILAGAPDPLWLAAAVEKSDRRLLDRLNTLLTLNKRRGELRAESFAVRIARQAQAIINQRVPPKPFSARRSFAHLAAFLALFGATIALYQVYSPWNRLVAVGRPTVASQVATEKPLDLAPPATNNLEQNRSWGEVRITEPGADLKVTKVDVVPLQIEAAANQPLKSVGWYSTVNGASEQSHELAAPAEPRYAAYQPTLYLDELNLTDWDVVTYHARAETEAKDSFASEVYFLEVRPFREDILKLPGGEGGKCYQILSELTSLINRQQHIIRQTHQHLQKALDEERLQAQDRKKLVEAEEDLRDSARHLYAKLAASMENKPIGEALDNLAKAEKSLDHAGGLLSNSKMPEAQGQERTALSELVAARKTFQKAITDNPKSFEDPAPEEPVNPQSEASGQLRQMTEFRSESKAVQDFVTKLLEEQKQVEQQARTGSARAYPDLARREGQLDKSLGEFADQHPRMFRDQKSQAQLARRSLDQAREAFQNSQGKAPGLAGQATRDLDALNQALQEQSDEKQLAYAYQLRQLLREQAQALDQRSKPDSKMEGAVVSNVVGQAQETLNQLKRVAEEEPTRNAFRQPLRDALSGQNKVDLDARLLRLQQGQGEAETQQRAGEARDGLAKVEQAFDASLPGSLQAARQADSLKPGRDASFAEGMAELDSLVRQLERGHQMSPSDQAKQGRQALVNLRNGLREQFGDNEQADKVLVQLERLLADQRATDAANLKNLLEALQHFSVETAEQLARTQDRPEVSNVDPARLPAAYRGRIQKYFQKLSEK